MSPSLASPSTAGRRSDDGSGAHSPEALALQLSRKLAHEDACLLASSGASGSALSPFEHDAVAVAPAAGAKRARFGKLRTIPTVAAIVEHHLQHHSSLEELMLELYHAPLALRQLDDITARLWQDSLNSDDIRQLIGQISDTFSSWLQRPLGAHYPVVFVDGTWLKRKSGYEEYSTAVLTAIGVDPDGHREVLAVLEGAKEDPVDCEQLFRSLRSRGVERLGLVVGDVCSGLHRAFASVFPAACFQGCTTRFREHVLAEAAAADLSKVDAMLRAIHAGDDAATARVRLAEAAAGLKAIAPPRAAAFLEEFGELTLPFFAYPRPIRSNLASGDWLRRILREVRERARVVGAFSDAPSGVLLVSARLRHHARLTWTKRCYLRPELLTSSPPA